jgi:F-type H+-transporting ATPase subunit gamma
MEQIEQLKKKIESAKELQSVVKTMKALAAVNIRSLESAARSMEDYVETVEMGLHIAMLSHQAKISEPRRRRRKTGIVVFGSGRGMSGQFNAKIASFVFDHLKKMDIGPEERAIITIGDRIRPRLEREDLRIENVFPIADTVDEISPLVAKLITEIEQWRKTEKVNRILLFHNKAESGASYYPVMQYLLPLNLHWLRKLSRRKWESRSLPMFTMDWDDLFSGLIRQYFFSTVYRAFAESLAAENAARLASMQAAEKNIKELLEELSSKYNHQRQSQITSELLDIVSGFEALKE